MSHLIQNFSKLAVSSLRKQALEIVEAGFSAINTPGVVRSKVLYNPFSDVLEVCGKKFFLKKFKRIVCVGFGKAALLAVTEIQKILKDKISCGFVIDLKEGSLGNIICRVGTHPHPTKVNVKAAEELVRMLEACGEEDLAICVVSGGGSALLCSPSEMSCEQEAEIVAALTAQGANIFEINTVRKHVSLVKGGQLAKIIHPAACISLIFSDIPGDDISFVASGPTVKDKTTTFDAKQILKKYKILEKLGIKNIKLKETPKENKYFKNIHTFLLVSPKQALLAMEEKASDLGFEVKIFSQEFLGEARDLGPKIISESKRGLCLLGAGESTVKIRGKGKGGRNQEMVLSALPSFAENQVLACIASDGYDNTDAAGAIADFSTLAKAKSLGLNYIEYLANNDSYNFFSSVDGLIFTGLTGSNVSDFFVCLKGF